MKLEKLSFLELLALRESIDIQMKKISEAEKTIKKPKKKKRLGDMEKRDQIYCVNFYKDHIYYADYVDITFYKKTPEAVWVDFTSNHPKKPMGCSSSVRNEMMYKHYFLSEFSSSLYFFTLKPATMKEDLRAEIERLAELKTERFRKELSTFVESVETFIDGMEIQNLL